MTLGNMRALGVRGLKSAASTRSVCTKSGSTLTAIPMKRRWFGPAWSAPTAASLAPNGAFNDTTNRCRHVVFCCLLSAQKVHKSSASFDPTAFASR
jgi:hypothetical protein